MAAVFHAPFLRIQTVVVEGNEGIPANTIAEFVEQSLAGSYVYVIPKDNALMYPRRALAAQLLSRFPALYSVDVTVTDLTTLAVKVVERKPQALWCGESPASPSPCFLIDQGGVAYGNAVSFAGNAYVRFYGPRTEGTFPQQYLTQEEFRTMYALLEALTKKIENEPLVSVAVDDAKDVRAVFDSGFELLFSAKDDSASVYERFVLAQASEPLATRPLKDFEYLDLRFGDKLYYKLRNE